MNIEKINKIAKKYKLPNFRAKQLAHAVFKESANSFTDILTLPKELRNKLNKEFSFLSFEVKKLLSSKNKKSYKALLALPDGGNVETVLLKMSNKKWSACVSSQVGCAMDCKFCATGKLGFKRNLNSEEITDQILYWKNVINKIAKEDLLSNIVFMGMGEPFNNWQNVKSAINDLVNEDKFNFSSRHISISTSGNPLGIQNLAKTFPQINLAVSIISADEKTRSKLMPVNRKYSLAKLKEAIKKYLETTNRKIFFEYIMLDKINDSLKDADKLIDFVKFFKSKNLININLIAYNAASGEYSSSKNAKIEQFKNYLQKNYVKTTIRKSLGDDIKGACGQLAG